MVVWVVLVGGRGGGCLERRGGLGIKAAVHCTHKLLFDTGTDM